MCLTAFDIRNNHAGTARMRMHEQAVCLQLELDVRLGIVEGVDRLSSNSSSGT